jgi:putative redox protein
LSHVTLRRSGPRQFVGIDERHHTLTLDIAPEVGGEWAGIKPSELLPFALGSCIGVTAVGILEKMRQGPFDLTVDIEFEHATEPPRAFTRFDLTWNFRGDHLDLEKLKKAIETSEQKYCSVSASLCKDIVVRHDVRLQAQPVLH